MGVKCFSFGPVRLLQHKPLRRSCWLQHPPDIALEKIAITDNYFHLFHVVFSTSDHPCGPLWAHVGPYGPVYDLMLFLYDLYMVITLFLYEITWLYAWSLRCLKYLEKLILHVFYHILESSKDHFASPPAPKFALLCKLDFPSISYLLHNPIFFYIIDFIIYIYISISCMVGWYGPRGSYLLA